ncbi:MAG TPA: YciI family protein [Gaiellaceae bacterium]|nr:YciI family protein [Gaiellaceae bacterium]
MQYMLLIQGDEGQREALGDDERTAMFGEYFAFSDSIRDQTISSAPLEPSSVTTTVRVRDGETLITDGPFAETKEQLGGYYVIEAETLDEALEIAARCPGAKHGAVEVRPLMPIPARQP